MHILVVDDDSLIRWSLHQSLAARGHSVKEAGCGQEALSLLPTNHFDVILTDVELPKQDGFRIVEAYRASFPEIPVIMMSAYGAKSIREKALAYQINHFIKKPFAVDDVALLVESFL